MPEKLPEYHIATDVEADGPIPGPYSMLSLGMSVVGHPELSFYTEIKPISDDFVPKALEVSGLDREVLACDAPTPETAMGRAAKWINSLRKSGRPVFLAGPAVWDGMFVHWYFIKFHGNSPFGMTGSGIDLRSYWMGRTGCEWVATRKGRIKHELGLTGLPHTHHAGEDAAELAKVFEAILASSKGSNETAPKPHAQLRSVKNTKKENGLGAVALLYEWFRENKEMLDSLETEPEFRESGRDSACVRIESKTHLMELCAWDHASCLDIQIVNKATEESVFPHAGECESLTEFKRLLNGFIGWFRSEAPKST